MKLIYIFIFALFIADASFSQTKKTDNNTLKWHTSITEAQKVSNETKKPIFAFFTGSDWCGWCHRMQSNVFSKSSFIDWARKNVVLLELDYPRNKKLSPEIQKQNAELQQVFQISGFPTIWLFFLKEDPIKKKKNIEALGSLGYPVVTQTGNEDKVFLHNADSILTFNVKGKK